MEDREGKNKIRDFMKVGPIRCRDMSANSYHLKLRNIPEERMPRKDDARRRK
jgi:hypothetical protein